MGEGEPSTCRELTGGEAGYNATNKYIFKNVCGFSSAHKKGHRGFRIRDQTPLINMSPIFALLHYDFSEIQLYQRGKLGRKKVCCCAVKFLLTYGDSHRYVSCSQSDLVLLTFSEFLSPGLLGS